jgi:hypothetical protein
MENGMPSHLVNDPERMKAAQETVDAASEEAVELAMSAIFDLAIQWAVVQRSSRTK